MRRAAAAATPEEPPARRPSSRASRRQVSKASASVTVSTSSTSPRSKDPDIRSAGGVRTPEAPNASMSLALTGPYPSGITTMQPYPLAAASIARATPVLPDVGSTIVPPGRSRPRRSASRIIARAMRSFTLPPGLNHSSLAKIRAAPRAKRASSTSGVAPMDSSSASALRVSVEAEDVKALFPNDDNKKSPGGCRGFEVPWTTSVSLLRPPRRVALAAVNRLAVGRIERDLGLLAAAVAGHVVERPLASLSRGSLALVAARLATLGFVGESLAGVELLIVCGKKERAATIHTGE